MTTTSPRHHRVVLTEPVDAHHAGELRSRVFFVSELIEDFTFVARDGHITEVDLTIAAGADPTDLAAKLELVVTNDIRPMRATDPKVVWRSPADRPARADTFDVLVDKGLAFEAGEGQVALGEEVAWLMDYLDSRVLAIARRELSARQYRYPTLLPVDVLRRCGYLAAFPQFLMFATRLHADAGTYAEFAAAAAADRLANDAVLGYCRNSDYALPPTMCFHTFHQLRGTTSDDRVITARGKSFRFESRYHASLERLWDFTIREIVFTGTRAYVLDCRERMMRGVQELVAELDLTGHREVANDPFFCKADTADRILMQRMTEAKYEMRLAVGAGRTSAVASFNVHERFFAEAFDIEHDAGVPMHSGCTGVGLERITYAFLCQHGTDPQGWPASVRAALDSNP